MDVGLPAGRGAIGAAISARIAPVVNPEPCISAPVRWDRSKDDVTVGRTMTEARLLDYDPGTDGSNSSANAEHTWGLRGGGTRHLARDALGP